ncbi:unnamed protein product [Phyllotreta striolata]|uniref:Fatty acid-binding protein n=1 Tax=Phyllotreta striolata TaxID=444603 RepID=A0A9N9TAP6_PHYSR|nr:unnamed protein product [Phyllotreta striolata]
MSNRTEGEFKLVMNERFYEYLMALGLPSEKAQVVDSLKPTLIITKNEKEITITTKLDTHSTTSVLKIDQTVEEKLAALDVVQSYTTVGDDDITIDSIGAKGERGRRHFDFFENGLIMTLSSDMAGIPEATRFYRRLTN